MSGTTDPLVRHVPVAISAEALLQQWARQEAAPEGAAVVVDAEIAARIRGGVEWRQPDALAIAVLGRPTDLAPQEADVAWAAAGLGTARALEEVLGGRLECVWPDRVAHPRREVQIVVGATSSLGPGRVSHVTLAARVGPWRSTATRDALANALVTNLRKAATALGDPADLLRDYRARCALIEESVEIELLPHGSVRGRVNTVDETCSLVLVSPTGLRERVPVDAVAQVKRATEKDT